MRFWKCTTIAACALAVLPWAAVADGAKPAEIKPADAGSIKTTPVMKADHNVAGQPITFPQKDGEVTVSTIEFPPGAVLPVHKHPNLRIGYVLEGTLSVTNEETGKTDVFKPGQVLLEAMNVWHHGKNLGDTPVRILVIDTDQKGVPQTVLKK